jgi:hypothetical protein
MEEDVFGLNHSQTARDARRIEAWIEPDIVFEILSVENIVQTEM